MSMLAALVKAYERLPHAPPLGFSWEKIGFVVSLNADGSVANVTDLRGGEGKKRTPRMMQVPQPPKRASGIAPNFLWDKTAYALGVTNTEGRRTAQEHAAFVKRHLEALDGTDDPGLKALRAFLEAWRPEHFAQPIWPEEMKGDNIVFALESERLGGIYLHDRPEAKRLWERVNAPGTEAGAVPCLVTGELAIPARLHPSIKGVWGAQTAGASIVSFNLEAFSSYGHSQGENAPVSEPAAFKYTTALNSFLARDSKNRIQIGDTSVVFWADAPEPIARQAEGIFAAGCSDVDFATEEQNIGAILARMRKGIPLKQIEPALSEGVRFYVLGLAPNAARLSIRFWFEDDFGRLAENMQAYYQDMALEPEPANATPPTIWRSVLRTAPYLRDKKRFDSDRVSPLLAGELLRAILTGGRFPKSLLSLLLMRVRGDGLLDHLRASLIKATIIRSMRLEDRLPRGDDGDPKEDYLMLSDPDDPNDARRLGRLFAIIERAQRSALGDRINVTVADKFLGAASATPGRVIPNLIRNARQHHIKRLRNGHSDAEWIKDAEHARRLAAILDRDIGRLAGSFTQGYPGQLSSEEQGLFLIGYYQERYGQAKSGGAQQALATNEEQPDFIAEEQSE